MLDTNYDMAEASSELGCPVEQLLTPLTRFSRRGDGMYAIDNGAFSGFNRKSFLSLLEREWEARSLCRFVAVPDVVGSAIRTREVFDIWESELTGWPLAYVVQDGQEGVAIPWRRVAAVFVGGSTEWKLGRHAEACIRAAQCLGKWVHVGRVNTPGRFEFFERLGADSIDGSGLARYSWMRKAVFDAQRLPTIQFEERS